MLIKLNQVIKNLEGDPIKNADNKKDDLTMRNVCVNALLANYSDERDIDGNEKAKRYELAMKIHLEKKEIELEIDDVKLIKDLIGKMHFPLVVGQAYRILDPKLKSSEGLKT